MNESIILVAGANDFIWKALCVKLFAHGRLVVGTVRNKHPASKLPFGVEIVKVDTLGSDTDW